MAAEALRSLLSAEAEALQNQQLSTEEALWEVRCDLVDVQNCLSDHRCATRPEGKHDKVSLRKQFENGAACKKKKTHA